MKIGYNKSAFKAFAKELRRASWASAAVATALVYQYGNGITTASAVVVWAAVQTLAFLAESTQKGDKK